MELYHVACLDSWGRPTLRNPMVLVIFVFIFSLLGSRVGLQRSAVGCLLFHHFLRPAVQFAGRPGGYFLSFKWYPSGLLPYSVVASRKTANIISHALEMKRPPPPLSGRVHLNVVNLDLGNSIYLGALIFLNVWFI